MLNLFRHYITSVSLASTASEFSRALKKCDKLYRNLCNKLGYRADSLGWRLCPVYIYIHDLSEKIKGCAKHLDSIILNINKLDQADWYILHDGWLDCLSFSDRAIIAHIYLEEAEILAKLTKEEDNDIY